MTATDPRPRLAAALAAKLAPAAESLAAAYEETIAAEPPPQEDRALAEHHRAGRAALAHLRQLLALLDWAAAHLPEPQPELRGEAPEDPDPPPPAESGYDGGEDEFHYRSETYTGSQKTPQFHAWLAEQQRRFGPLVANEDEYDGSEDEYNFGERRYVGKLTTPRSSRPGSNGRNAAKPPPAPQGNPQAEARAPPQQRTPTRPLPQAGEEKRAAGNRPAGSAASHRRRRRQRQPHRAKPLRRQEGSPFVSPPACGRGRGTAFRRDGSLPGCHRRASRPPSQPPASGGGD